MTDTQRIVTADESDKINFTEMYVTHDGFRRDLERLSAAAAAGKTNSPQVQDGWENFKRQLHVHHTVEDAWLWPNLTRRVAGRPDDLALLEAMEAEHAVLDPQLAAVDEAMRTNAADLPERVETLRSVLEQHLTHEEEDALPLIQEVLTPKDWKGFRGAMARKQKLNGASVWIPWIVDGMSPSDAQKFLARMPPPLRLFYKLSWDARYRNRNMFSF
ncbi:hemerythrin domain-containing protein [Streptomyces sp. NPDC051976]|uniref:hemerythrin domain-containing protein n=1 Tax=Streptomyces sp. NPDC051976 TaxID=3154947 RepID=UPI00343B0E3E